MNIIFLDIDGVLNSSMYCRENKVTGLWGAYDIFIERLSRIAKEANAEIVLSSSWRKIKDTPHYKTHITKKFKKYNLKIFDFTVDLSVNNEMRGNRGFEINNWIANNIVDNYIIIDDEIEDIKNIHDASHIIKTEIEIGLTEEKVKEAIKKIKGKNKNGI